MPSSKSTASAPRALRADARRNRDAILAAAREVFETDGVLVPLDAIALRAGVGNATLYRNFPTRDDLLAAVMESSLEEGLGEADELARNLEPRAALEEWLFRLAWRLRIWHDLPECIATSHQAMSDGAPAEPSPSALSAFPGSQVAATDVLLARAAAVDQIAAGIVASEVFELVTALSWAVDQFGDDEAAARRRVAIGTAGIFA